LFFFCVKTKYLSGISIDGQTGNNFLTVGQDSQLKIWALPVEDSGVPFSEEPCYSLALNGVPHSVSHVADSSNFATCGDGISVWKLFRLIYINLFNKLFC
jgi:hypothetical protein